MRVFWARAPALAPHSLCGRGQFLPSVFPTWEMVGAPGSQVSATPERIVGKKFISCCPKRKLRSESEKGRRKGAPEREMPDLYSQPSFSPSTSCQVTCLFQPHFPEPDFRAPTPSRTRGSWVGF